MCRLGFSLFIFLTHCIFLLCVHKDILVYIFYIVLWDWGGIDDIFLALRHNIGLLFFYLPFWQYVTSTQFFQQWL